MTEKDRLLAEIDEEVLNDEDEQQDSIDAEKEEERRRKAEALWMDVQQGNTKYLITRVASILNRYPETRNSDIALQIKYWQVYENLRGDFISLNKLFKLERLTSIARCRAKIQNEYGLFLADEKYRRYRRDKEERQKEFQIATKPAMPIVSIYADETGKNDEYVIVGGIWILDERREGELNSHLIQWVQNRKQEDPLCPDEFHFNKVRNNGTNLEVYKDFFNQVIGQGDMISFKAVAVKKSKLNKPIDEIVKNLYYQLVRLGIEHEKNTKRISLPKQVRYIKDEEQGESSLRLKEIQQSIIDNFKIHYNNDLKLNCFVTIDSKMSRFIQVADLFTGALNRRYNVKSSEDNKNAKDELADYILDIIGLEEIKYPSAQFEDNFENNVNSDMATIYIFD
jgi:Protein of unknown function (DUF3800)